MLATTMTITFIGLIRAHGGGGGGGETTTWDPEGTTWDTTWAPGGTTFETTPENTTTFDPEETTMVTTVPSEEEDPYVVIAPWNGGIIGPLASGSTTVKVNNKSGSQRVVYEVKIKWELTYSWVLGTEPQPDKVATDCASFEIFHHTLALVIDEVIKGSSSANDGAWLPAAIEGENFKRGATVEAVKEATSDEDPTEVARVKTNAVHPLADAKAIHNHILCEIEDAITPDENAETKTITWIVDFSYPGFDLNMYKSQIEANLQNIFSNHDISVLMPQLPAHQQLVKQSTCSASFGEDVKSGAACNINP
jgi:hypothetical protein